MHNKCWVQGHFYCTYHIFGTQTGWSRKASNTHSRDIHENSSDIQMIFSHARKRSKDEANQPQQESALDHKWFSNSYGWSMVFILVFIVFTKLMNWTSYCYLESEIGIYMTILYSNIANVSLYDICIHFILRTWLVHIVIYSDHSWKIKWF